MFEHLIPSVLGDYRRQIEDRIAWLGNEILRIETMDMGDDKTAHYADGKMTAMQEEADWLSTALKKPLIQPAVLERYRYYFETQVTAHAARYESAAHELDRSHWNGRRIMAMFTVRYLTKILAHMAANGFGWGKCVPGAHTMQAYMAAMCGDGEAQQWIAFAESQGYGTAKEQWRLAQSWYRLERRQLTHLPLNR